MSHGSKDWTKLIEVTVNTGQPANQAAAGDTGTYSGTNAAYQTVAAWTVAAGKTGVLVEILIISDDYDNTTIKVTIGSVTYCDGFAPKGAMPMIFESLRLSAGDVVTVYAKSNGVDTINVDAIITGIEVG